MDFGRTHGIPKKFEDAVTAVVEGVARTIDVGRVSRRARRGRRTPSVGMTPPLPSATDVGARRRGRSSTR
jgi:hypothetical protein